jgi:hypothetical protein
MVILFFSYGKIKNFFTAINPETATSQGKETFVSWFSTYR